MLYFTIILNSIAAAIQGWDQTGNMDARTIALTFLLTMRAQVPTGRILPSLTPLASLTPTIRRASRSALVCLAVSWGRAREIHGSLVLSIRCHTSPLPCCKLPVLLFFPLRMKRGFTRHCTLQLQTLLTVFGLALVGCLTPSTTVWVVEGQSSWLPSSVFWHPLAPQLRSIGANLQHAVYCSALVWA